MKILIGLIFVFFSISAFSQNAIKTDGEWLRQGLLAGDRVAAANASNLSQDDSDKFLHVAFYIRGVLDTESQKTLLTALYASALPKPLSKADQEKARLAFAYAPLLSLPDTFTGAQAFAITKAFLEKNPKRWNENASRLIVDAIADAYRR